MSSNLHSLNARHGSFRGRRAQWLFVLHSVWLVSVGVSAHGQVDDDDVVVVAAAERQVVITEQQFDQLIFGSGARAAQVVRVANGVQRIEMVAIPATATGFRQSLEVTLSAEIEKLDALCSLTQLQKKKLGLAGRGDIHQVFSRIAEMRPKMTSFPIARERYAELMNELQPLRMGFQQGLFGENSLFRKTLRRTLTDEQNRSLQRLVHQQQTEAIETVLRNLERATSPMKLNDEIRRKFIDVLIEHGHFPPTSTPYMQYIVLLEANRLEEQLKPLLDDAYWQTFQTHVTLAKRFEPTLRRNGQWPVVPESDDETAEPSTKK